MENLFLRMIEKSTQKLWQSLITPFRIVVTDMKQFPLRWLTLFVPKKFVSYRENGNVVSQIMKQPRLKKPISADVDKPSQLN